MRLVHYLQELTDQCKHPSMDHRPFSFRERLKSFTFAINGLRILIATEHNAQIHLVAAAVVTLAGLLFGISAYEWIALVFAMGIVIALECVNSAIERIADFISPERHESIKAIKDLSAAAVLAGAVSAAIVGIIIFAPRIMALCS